MAATTVVVVVDIDGMTCMSCVRNIEGTLAAKGGVLNVKVKFELVCIKRNNQEYFYLSWLIALKVDLEKKQGTVVIDGSVMTPDDIVESIEDMGFSAKLSGNPDKRNVDINISGMTCQSCVRNIESNVAKMKGIFSIKVRFSILQIWKKYFIFNKFLHKIFFKGFPRK